ncbi:MAG: hypothetical protein H7X77_10450 [Anaerolineae bacterium]|nr:hypothetical protein [Anaerolineae bacterium]
MQTQTTIRCSNCGQPFPMAVRSLIDVAKDPQGKALLLAGQLNTAQCPQCGTVNAVSVPLLYHDPAKELLLALVPMELNMNKDQQERVVGDLMKGLPKENFKGYMFNPKRALTMQGLLEQVLQADGITPAMMEEQKKRVALIQDLVEASDDILPAMIQQNDPAIDLPFFQAMGMMAQRLAQSGRPDIAERILATQQFVLEYSTYGKQVLQQQAEQEAVIAQVAQEVQAMGEQANRNDFMNLARQYAGDENRLQALVGLVRPAFDNQFFQDLGLVIGQAPADERAGLETLRDKMLEFASMIDRQSQAQVQVAVQMLQAMISLPPEQVDLVIRENLPMINDTFMAVLTANIQEAERRGDLNASSRLKQIYEKVVSVLQESMQPELVFVNQLLSVESDSEAKAMLENQAKEFGEPLLEVMDAVGQMLDAQGEDEMVQRLADLRRETVSVLQK